MITRQFDPKKNNDRRMRAYVDLSWLEAESFEKVPKRREAPTPTHDCTARNRGRHRGWATYRFRRAQRAVGGLCKRHRHRQAD